MEKEIENFIKEAKGVSLSASEKASAGSNIMDFVKSNPASATPSGGEGAASQAAASSASGLSVPVIAVSVVIAVALATGGVFVAFDNNPEPAGGGSKVVDEQTSEDDSIISDEESVITEIDDDKEVEIDPEVTDAEKTQAEIEFETELLEIINNEVKTLPTTVAECIRGEVDLTEVLGESDEYLSRYSVAKEFCEESFITTQQDNSETTEEQEFTTSPSSGSNQ